MAKRAAPFHWVSPLSSLILSHGSDTLCYTLFLLSLFSLLLHHLSLSTAALSPPNQPPLFEGFGDELEDSLDDPPVRPTDLPLSASLTLSDFEAQPDLSQPPDPPPPPKSAASQFEYWDEDEFEGIPTESTPEPVEVTENVTPSESQSKPLPNPKADFVEVPKFSGWRSFTVEFVCIGFLIAFSINYFTGRRKNENIALTWAAKFAARDSVFEKNFSLLGAGHGEDSPLLLKEGQNVFKFYAGGRRYCKGLLATMELKSRHDLFGRIYDMMVSRKDGITFEVYMNDDAMDQVVFALVKRKAAKGMHKELPDLQRLASLMSKPSNRKWVSEELLIITESKEVAMDIITDSVLDQVFGEKAFEKFRKAFISMHFSDQHPGTQKKKLLFKFALPGVNCIDDMARLVALVPYYIDLVGKYKLSSQARSKTDAARVKAAQEAYKEVQNARQEVIQKKKAERRKMMEEAEAKLSAEAIRRREAKELSRQMKKSVPKVKMSRA